MKLRKLTWMGLATHLVCLSTLVGICYLGWLRSTNHYWSQVTPAKLDMLRSDMPLAEIETLFGHVGFPVQEKPSYDKGIKFADEKKQLYIWFNRNSKSTLLCFYEGKFHHYDLTQSPEDAQKYLANVSND